MKSANFLLAFLILAFIGVLVADALFFSHFEKHFKALEHERIVTSNQLATAKIVSENLNHVRDLVYQNMDFASKPDSIGADLAFYRSLTESVNDLKMRLHSIRPTALSTQGRVTTYGYDLELEGDFFSFGEFCSKLENNRHIMTLASFDLEPKGGSDSRNIPGQSRRALHIKMHLNTYRVRK